MLLTSGFILGLLGSLHCLGMCGPIALMVPVKSKSFSQRLRSSLLYNLGRILTYSIFGMLFGLMGTGLVLAGVQQWVSLSIGALIILAVLVPKLIGWINPKKSSFLPISKIQSGLRKRFSNTSSVSLFTMGILNGLLPCGFVYMAVVGAIATGTWYQGAAYMALFGAGTIPIMLTLPIIGSTLKFSFKEKIRKAYPVLMLLFGVLFLLRGMNLNIPYLSPEMSKEEPKAHCCHKK